MGKRVAQYDLYFFILRYTVGCFQVQISV